MTEPLLSNFRCNWKRGFRLYAVVTIGCLAVGLPFQILVGILSLLGLSTQDGLTFYVLTLLAVLILGCVIGPVVLYRIAYYFGVRISEDWSWSLGSQVDDKKE